MIQVDKMVFLAQKGDPYARSALLASNRRLVKKTASGICNRFLQWNKDRELEIAINAFDEAIDIFPRQKEDDFLCFAHSLICLRVYEHLESEGKISDLNIPFKEDERIADLLQKPNYADREKKIARLWEKYRDFF
ncbi:MAG: hypothetical protein M1119_12630, partial [Firmicutes bacterium]|nr:hypothetical protein [Bacillota bacterium]